MMQMANGNARRVPRDGAEFEPLAVRLPVASRLSGFSRSELYRRAARGEIVFLKSGSTTLVDMASLRCAVSSLPRAVIRKSPAIDSTEAKDRAANEGQPAVRGATRASDQ
jgi:hypothetical protein